MIQVADSEIWNQIRTEAARDAQHEPALASFLYTVVLSHQQLEDALGYILASKLGSPTVAGVPARRVGFPAHAMPALEMDQSVEQLDKP